MAERNKAVLLAHGREEVEQRIEREFERVGALVTRDLQGYPALQRKLLDEITRVEEDYKQVRRGAAAAARLGRGGRPRSPRSSPTATSWCMRVLEEINRSINTIHDKTLAEYRRAYESRHKILDGFMPFWRSLDKTLGQVDRNMTSLHDQRRDDRRADGEATSRSSTKTDKAEHALTVSAFTQFAIAALVLAVAAGGALHQLQADRAADVGDGRRGRLHHRRRCAPPRWRRW